MFCKEDLLFNLWRRCLHSGHETGAAASGDDRIGHGGDEHGVCSGRGETGMELEGARSVFPLSYS